VKVTVKSAYDNGSEFGDRPPGGGDHSALRAYQAYHPDAAIYTVTFHGRTVWMTSKQRAIWSYAQRYKLRGVRLTMSRIAKAVGCSPATVSRFLRKLDLWRFIDLATLQGRTGGTYIFKPTAKLNEYGQKHTQSSRARARAFLAAMVKRAQLSRLQPALDRYHIPRKPWKGYGSQEGIWYEGKIGNTGATFRRKYA
jgi:hypothetical protein